MASSWRFVPSLEGVCLEKKKKNSLHTPANPSPSLRQVCNSLYLGSTYVLYSICCYPPQLVAPCHLYLTVLNPAIAYGRLGGNIKGSRTYTQGKIAISFDCLWKFTFIAVDRMINHSYNLNGSLKTKTLLTSLNQEKISTDESPLLSF